LFYFMKNTCYFLLALAALASCRESNMSAQSAPTAGATARVLRYDTTFINIAQRTKAYRYVADLRVGNKTQVTIPVEINWTTTQAGGCPQVASVQVYQLNGGDRRTTITAKAVRQATCRAGLGPDGKLGTATTGMALVSITGQAKDVKFRTTTSCLLNGLGYHDSLSYANPAARR
jgi:hypothetical protein